MRFKLKQNNKSLILVTYAHEAEAAILKKTAAEATYRPKTSFVRMRDLTSINRRTKLVLNIGFAGRLDPELKVGEVILAAGFSFAPAQDFARSRKIRIVSLTTSDIPVLDSKYRDELRWRTGADIVDMEAGRLEKQAASAGTLFVCFKVVSDKADSNAWDEIKRHKVEFARRLSMVADEFLNFFHAGFSNNTGLQ